MGNLMMYINNRIIELTDIIMILSITIFPGGASGKESTCQCRRCKRHRMGQEDRLEAGTETHSSILIWRIPWTEEPGGLQSMRSQRVEYN